MVKVILPDLGENISKATISYWHVQEGATVKEGEDLVELATDKATFNVPAPCSGTLIKVLAGEGESVPVGEVLAMIQEEAGPQAA